ncbi:MAG: adenosylcobinamide-GDP ribazoletransferase [Steroidobacteraceae bacterium]|jgi:adenosylcobinamide-GDP ribazoletransferase
MSRQLRLLCVATQFLTRLPTPRLREFDQSWLSQSTRYFPLVGVLIGLVNILVWWIASRRLPASVSIGLMMAVSMLLTGAFHEDGFADTCDGLGGGGSKERVLAIMKDSRIGAFGAIGLFFMLGLKWTTLAALPSALFVQSVLASHVVSRWYAIGLIAFLPYVREDADAKSKAFAGRLGGGDWILSGVLGLLGLAPLAWAYTRDGAPLDWAALGTGACAAAALALATGLYLRHRIGGYTGDCLGAVQQLTELGFLLGGLTAVGSAHGLT